jgi:hypothetical protein
MDDADATLLDALDQLSTVADALTADEAVDQLDDVTVQEFWREWPHVSAWAGALWRRINTDIVDASRPIADPDQDEVGGSG